MSTEATIEPPADHDDPEVVRVLEFYLAEVEAGRDPDRAGLLAQHPHIVEQLAECLDGLDLLRQAIDPPAAWPTPDGRLGDYRLLRLIGRGGMGSVYEAEHARTGDRVAVKVLNLAAGLSDLDRRRFQHEIHAASSLAHPHIVPVLAVGVDRGVHFFAMPRIGGHSLAELIARPSSTGQTTQHTRPHDPTPPALAASDIADDTPTSFELPRDPKVLAGVMVQAAEALGHAHAAGIVHRDVKPANLLLDADGHTWVADFGLAFVPGLSRLTQSAALVGTLRYMSPEQVEPRRGGVDHRADLYGLGATCYELLTRRAVYDDADRGTLIQRILHAEPAPPRSIDPTIPYDLETIVLTLLAKDPTRRYASMADLADDLRRFRAGESIHARRPSALDRGIVWLDRHRRVAVATLALFVAVVAVVIGILKWKNADIAAKRDEVAAERDKSDDAVDTMYTQFAETVLAREPRQELRHRQFLLKALAHYERRANESGSSGESRLSAALARRRVADVSHHLGRDAEARQAYDRAVNDLQGLATTNPSSHRHTRELAIAVNDRGNWHRANGSPADARSDYQRAAELFAALRANGSTDLFDRVASAGVENNLGLLALASRDTADAERWFQSARARYAKLAIEQPLRTEYLSDAAMSSHNLAEVYVASNRVAEAEPIIREALTLHEQAFARDPGAPAYRCELARTRKTCGEILARRGQRTEAVAMFEASLAGWRQLAADYPLVPAYRSGCEQTAIALANAKGSR